MQDLTKGSITGHIVKISSFIVLTMLFQTMYFLADLYWVGRLGRDAVAAVGLAGNFSFLVLAVTQMLSVGATALVAMASGRKEQAEANRLFHQSISFSIFLGAAITVAMFLVRGVYSHATAADATTANLSIDYLTWYIPAMFMQFPLAAMSASLRGTGVVKPAMIIGVGTVALNIVLAPVLIFGWVSHHPLGVAGAAIASLIAVALGALTFVLYFIGKEKFLHFTGGHNRPELAVYKKILGIGAPAGAEFLLLGVFLILIYAVIKPFGASAQAGFGIGLRLMQSIFLPGMSIGFAMAPVVGQNYGAKNYDRVRQTFRDGAMIITTVMVVFIALAHIAPEAMVRFFSSDPAVVAVGADYFRIISFNFVATGLVYAASSVFQGLGNTLPSLASSASRLVLFAGPVVYLSRQPGFTIRQVWWVSVVSVTLQCGISLMLLAREFKRKLPRETPNTSAAKAAV